jgi:hypothetical protein
MTDERRQSNGESGDGSPCGPAVYWFWSRVPSRAEAERQVRELAGAGVALVMIQARLSMERDSYLSDEYLRGYRDAVQAAGAAGLKVGIYDEYNWMSGHGGGRTVRGAGHLRERHLFWATATATGDANARATISEIRSDWFDGLGPAGARWIYEQGVRRFDEWELVAAVAHPRGEVDPAAAVEVTGWAGCRGGADGCAMSLAGEAPVPEGWTVTYFVSARCASSRAVNYLDPRSAERFLEVAYQPYLEALAGLIGDPVQSFSFDHPYGGFYDWREREGPVTSSLMWHPSARLADDPELSPGQLLLAVVRDLGPGTIRPRCRFFSAYSSRGIDSFFGTLGTWTREHGVGLTGHELLAHVGGWELYGAFPDLDIRTNFGGDYFAVDRIRSETLVDASNFSAQLSPVMGDSLARAHGRARCTVEQYAARREPPEDFAAGYWELTLRELRLQALRLHLLGARRFLFHAFGQSDGTGENDELLSNPRFDFPPTCNFEPWFAHFAEFAAESAAVSSFMEGAEPVRDVALVYPLYTLWAAGQAHPHGRLFGEWAQLLARAGVGFDVVDDRALDAATVRDGQVTIHGRPYRVVVLAGTSVLPSLRPAGVLEDLAATGGAVLASAPLPGATAAEGPVDGLAERIAAVCAEPPRDVVPARVPAAIVERGSAPTVDAGEGPGTLWRWIGRAGETTRVVLLNDGPERRRVRIAEHAGLELEPEEIVCLELAGGVRRIPLPAAAPAPDREDSAALALGLGDGWTLTIPGVGAVAVDPGVGWERQGLESFAGTGTYRCRFDGPAGAAAGERWMLTLPVVECAARAELNGRALGARAWPPYRFEIAPDVLRAAGNELVIEVANAAANRYYAGTRFQRGLQPGGLGAPPVLRRAGSAAPTAPTAPAVGR